ncbi:MAG: 4Fe-4S binding protein, partial [Muribaculaceae bacterium]|nr:4Fe-4S binding protein [Muribaculaceae bacterium]
MLASVFLIGALAWLILGPARFSAGRVVEEFQVIPSALAVTLGATAFWTVVTFLFGRIYCSTVCPIGSLLDIAWWTRRCLKGSARPARFTPPVGVRYTLLWIYLGTLVIGWMPLAFLIEPWNVMRNIASVARPDDVSATWVTLRGLGSG